MKKCILILSLLMTAGNLLADNFNVANFTIKKGETTNLVINYQFDETGLYAGYQFELKLPTGISTIRDQDGVSEFTASSAHGSTYIISNSYDAESGAVIFVAFSLQAKAIQGSNGTLLTIPVKVDDNIADETVFNGSLENIQLSKLDGNTTVNLNNVAFSVTVTPTAAIGSVFNEQENNTLIYNLAGQRVNHPSKGLYIQRSKKFVVK